MVIALTPPLLFFRQAAAKLAKYVGLLPGFPTVESFWPLFPCRRLARIVLFRADVFSYLLLNYG